MYKKENFPNLDSLMDFVNQTEDYDCRPVERKVVEILDEKESVQKTDNGFNSYVEMNHRYTLIYTEEYL